MPERPGAVLGLGPAATGVRQLTPNRWTPKNPTSSWACCPAPAPRSSKPPGAAWSGCGTRTATAAAARVQLINKAYQKIRQCRTGTPGESFEPDSPHGPAAPAPCPPAADNGAAQSHVHVRKVRLTIEAAALGCTRSLRGRLSCACASCAGLRAQVLPCQACRGKGVERRH